MKKTKNISVIFAVVMAALFLTACGAASEQSATSADAIIEDALEAETGTVSGLPSENAAHTEEAAAPVWQQMSMTGSMELDYAQCFTVDYYDDVYALITLKDSDRYLLVPEGKAVPEGVDEEIVILQQPFEHIYLTATSAMDLFRAINCIGNIRLSGTDADGWYIPEAKAAMENGEMLFAGKYSAPDYELILSEQCDLAIESTMIYHTPEVQEQLENAGIPVLVEYSSYETNPLGRMEWIKLYGVLMNQLDTACSYFESQEGVLQNIVLNEGEPKSVAFFYVTSNGAVNVRKSKDYVAQMISLAGGKYVFNELGEEDNALSTMTIQMETFYDRAKEADYLIYNSAIDAELENIEQLLEKSALFADFKAVKSGNVWCTGKNMFQESTGLADMILDFNKILTDDTVRDEELTYLHRLN
ncbi:MAG: ABC transporter substrate-binding protein [Lachnospiraceae bacterium]|nr:ABC transporter substrate-binding protein [Lachnospiraceae bacterium]